MTELRNKIITLCNQSGLTIEQIMFILKDIYRDSEEAYLEYKRKSQQLDSDEIEEDEEEEIAESEEE